MKRLIMVNLVLLGLAGCFGGGGQEALRITAQPADSMVVAGSTATFSVQVAGEATGYQWQREAGGSWSDIAGATTTRYTTPATVPADDGQRFRVLVADASTTLTSSAARLTVTAAPVAPTIAAHPGSQAVVAPAEATFTVTASGTSLAYQWQQSSDGATWSDLAGATGTAFSTGATSTALDGRRYRVVITNSVGSVTSTAALLTVSPAPSANTAPVFTTQPADQSVADGQSATFSVAVTGTPAPELQWQSSGDGGASWTNLGDATAVRYITPATTPADDGRRYRVQATNSAGSAFSSVAVLHVAAAEQAPYFILQPQDHTVAEGTRPHFTVEAAGVPTPTLQWQMWNSVDLFWMNMNGATEAECCDLTASLEDDGVTVRAVATSSAGTAYSDEARLTVNAVGPPPGILVQPTDVTVTARELAVFSVTASGQGLEYQWYEHGEGWDALPGATHATLALADFPSSYSNRFRVVVRNAAGSVASNDAHLYVDTGPTNPPGGICESCMTTIPGYEGDFPRIVLPLDTTVTAAGAPLLAATFGWDRPGPFSWSPTRTDDQVWSFDPASGISTTLTLPWGTFIESLDFTATPVTLAPVAGDGPLPFGSILAAFDLAPADLMTQQPFRLAFTLDAAVLATVQQQDVVAFTADSDGRNLRFAPLVPGPGGTFSAGALQLGLNHFGIVGLATLPAAQHELLVQRWPRDIAAQQESAVAAAQAGARAAALTPGGSAVTGRVRALSRVTILTSSDNWVTDVIRRQMNYFNYTIVPAFAAAYGGGELEIEVAMQIGLEWLRGTMLIGTDQIEPVASVAADLSTRIYDLMDRHADLVKLRCTSGGGFPAFRDMIKEIRQLELLGREAKSTELSEAVGACSSFTVRYRQEWTDTNTNASLFGAVEGSANIIAPTYRSMKTLGSLPNGIGELPWISFHSTTTDTNTIYDNSGNVVGSCSTTTVGTGTTGSKFKAYVKDYGLSFLKGGGHKPITVLFWPYGMYGEGPGVDHIPMGIHYSRTTSCEGQPSGEWDGTATPDVNDPQMVNRGDGMRIVSLPWSGGNYRHEWSIRRGAGLHPTTEQYRLEVDPGQ